MCKKFSLLFESLPLLIASVCDLMVRSCGLQVTLGISTLLLYVPVSLGSAHQAGALTLFTVVLTLLHTLRKPTPAAIRALSSKSSLVVAGSKTV